MNAWEAGDAEAVMALLADDGVYCASVGPEPGLTYAGRQQLRQGVVSMLAFEAGGESRQGDTWFCDDHAFAQWSYDEIGADGTATQIRGIDVIAMAAGKITSIDAYRKCR